MQSVVCRRKSFEEPHFDLARLLRSILMQKTRCNEGSNVMTLCKKMYTRLHRFVRRAFKVDPLSQLGGRWYTC